MKTDETPNHYRRSLVQDSSINSPSKAVWQPWIPHALVTVWLLYLGIIIWQHVVHSVQPPTYDPLSYLQKAMNFWQAIEQGRFVNPFNVQPVLRPPGTILMSYPFGFSPDFHGFLFRSVYLPILCIVGAVYMVAGMNQVRTAGWRVAAMALLISSLPMFYGFEWSEDIPAAMLWGLVDNFQAGIAAMAAAAMVRSLQTRSQRWLMLAAVLGALTLLIKPSGMLIMALLPLMGLIVVAMEWWRSRKASHPDSSMRGYLLKGGALMLAVYGGAVAVSLLSGYLSLGNFAYAQQALTVMRAVLDVPPGQLLDLFHRSSGEALVLWVIVASALFLYQLAKAGERDTALPPGALGLWVGSLVIWGLGAWFWLVVQAGGSQIRYFYPFMLMGVICMIPGAMYAWPRANHVIRSLLVAICLLPAANIAVLLAAGDAPSATWQRMTGVNVTIGSTQEEARQAHAFLDELRKANRSARLYSFSNGVLPAIFECVGEYERIVRPELPGFRVSTPIDWLRGFVVRTDALLNTDYVLIRKYAEDGKKFSKTKKIDSYYAESMAFELWLAGLDKQAGVEVVSDGRVLRLLRIVDKSAFNRAIEEFVSARVWRPEFIAANQPVWVNGETIPAIAKSTMTKDIEFGGIYKLHALTVSRTSDGIKVDAWWEELRHEDANNERYLFLHLLDASGKILRNRQIALFPYEPQNPDRRWRHSEVTFDPEFHGEKMASLSFGIYRPSGEYLLADKGWVDYEGKRILIPLDAASGAQTGAGIAGQR